MELSASDQQGLKRSVTSRNPLRPVRQSPTCLTAKFHLLFVTYLFVTFWHEKYRRAHRTLRIFLLMIDLEQKGKKSFFRYASRVRKHKINKKYQFLFCFLHVNENTPHFRGFGTEPTEVFMNAKEQFYLALPNLSLAPIKLLPFLMGEQVIDQA